MAYEDLHVTFLNSPTHLPYAFWCLEVVIHIVPLSNKNPCSCPVLNYVYTHTDTYNQAGVLCAQIDAWFILFPQIWNPVSLS